jgi:hypothetical protein
MRVYDHSASRKERQAKQSEAKQHSTAQHNKTHQSIVSIDARRSQMQQKLPHARAVLARPRAGAAPDLVRGVLIQIKFLHTVVVSTALNLQENENA